MNQLIDEFDTTTVHSDLNVHAKPWTPSLSSPKSPSSSPPPYIYEYNFPQQPYYQYPYPVLFQNKPVAVSSPYSNSPQRVYTGSPQQLPLQYHYYPNGWGSAA